jgi:hypothetical protein
LCDIKPQEALKVTTEFLEMSFEIDLYMLFYTQTNFSQNRIDESILRIYVLFNTFIVVAAYI